MNLPLYLTTFLILHTLRSGLELKPEVARFSFSHCDNWRLCASRSLRFRLRRHCKLLVLPLARNPPLDALPHARLQRRRCPPWERSLGRAIVERATIDGNKRVAAICAPRNENDEA